MKSVLILGATGSIGTSVLSVIRSNRDRFTVTGMAARRGGGELAALSREFPDADIAFYNDVDEEAFRALAADRGGRRRLLAGPSASLELASTVAADICVAAISGTAGLASAFAAAKRGMRILLADKEVMVSAGRLFLEAAREGGAEIIPLDSEHCALFQCCEGRDPAGIEKMIITASGGPFRTWDPGDMAVATPQDALRHPVWKMGAKISIDSATMANKALEVIEAHGLFGLPFERLEVLVHPESIIHGMVEFTDGSLLAQMGSADMRGPASFGLFYPEREKTTARRLNLAEIGRLNFDRPDPERFPMLRIGVEAGRRGERCSAMFNAANEAAVEAFLAGTIRFGDIAAAVEDAVKTAGGGGFASLGDVEDAHRLARSRVDAWIAGNKGNAL